MAYLPCDFIQELHQRSHLLQPQNPKFCLLLLPLHPLLLLVVSSYSYYAHDDHLPRSNSGSTTAIDAQTPTDQNIDAPVSTSQDILATQEERDSTAAAMAPILTLVGSIVGAVILLSAITVLILLMAYLVRKNKILKRELNSGNGREMRSSMAEKTDTVDIVVDTNPSYIPLCTQISTENNVAYGEVTMNQDGNDLYEIMDPPIEDSTTQFVQDGRSGEYTTEYYDYVN